MSAVMSDVDMYVTDITEKINGGVESLLRIQVRALHILYIV